MKDKLRFKGLYFLHGIYHEMESFEENYYLINQNTRNDNDYLILFKEKIDDVDDFTSYYIPCNLFDDENNDFCCYEQ